MEDDHEVAFHRDHVSDTPMDDTLPDEINDMEVAPVGPGLPDAFMEENESLECEAHFRALQARRREEETKLELQRYHIIMDKNNVVKELLQMYRDNEAISSQKLVISFEGEQANGEGLLRELYSLFWESFFSQNCEGSNQYTLCVSPNLSEEDFIALGRLITHMFIQCGTFLVKLCLMKSC